MASSLPTDLLLEILLRLEEPTDVIRCAGVCKPWRHAIISNAASLRPRPGNRFDPNLLLGVFHFGEYEARLWRTPGPFQSALPSNGSGGGYETARSLIPDAPAAGACRFVDDRGLYRELLWSADGFVLLMARTVNRLCLFNPMTGDCAFLLDVRTGRTWTTELPQSLSSRRPILATSGDGRLSLLETSLPGPRIRVWVLLNDDDGDARWSLQQTTAVDVSNLRSSAHWPDDNELALLLARSLSTFC